MPIIEIGKHYYIASAKNISESPPLIGICYETILLYPIEKSEEIHVIARVIA